MLGFVDIGHDDRELVPAEPGDGVLRADRTQQTLRDVLQQFVSHDMAQRIVDDLETVDVDVQERHRLRRASRMSQRLGERDRRTVRGSANQ